MNITDDMDTWLGLMAGVDVLADSIKYTLGPEGRNVAMHQKAGLRGADYSDAPQPGAHILITNDGATIARSLVLKDPLKNMGVQLLKEAAAKTNDSAGDGTSTTALLTQVLLHEAFRAAAAGANPLSVRRGMKQAADIVLEELKKMAVPVKTSQDIAKAASISCQDEELGHMISEAFSSVGLEGVINVDESQRAETTLEIQEGIVFDRGYTDPVMCTDKEQQIAELQDPYILLCDNTFTDPQDLIPYLILAAEDGHPCLIISEGVKDKALGLIMQNRIEGDMDIVCVNAPEYGEGRRWRMEDLALQTGGVYITSELGFHIRKVTREMLGTAHYVKVTGKQTMITGPGGDPEKIQKRIQELRYLSEHTDYDFNRNRYKERLAKFVSGVAYIHVGGQTEPEIWERKMRVEDGVCTARASCEEGILPGGGVALLNIAPKIKAAGDTLTGDERFGFLAVYQALKTPARQILDNAGLDGAFITEKLLEKEPGTGYDINTERYINMVAAGIVDSAKVTRLAFENALSAAGTIATAAAGIAGKRKSKGGSD